jgi:hypothetical protein
MAFVTSSLSLNTINSLTLPLIAQKISDTITGRIPLFWFLNKIGHKEYENGGIEYRFPILQGLATAQAYTGNTVLTNVERDFVTSAVIQRKQFTQDITLSGTKLLQNSGDDETAVVNYIAAQVEIAMEGLINTLAGNTLGIFSNQADGDLGITGLATMLQDSATTGTYAGLDRSVYTTWQQQTGTATTNFATTGLSTMRTLQLACVRGDEAPTVIVMSRASYAMLDTAMTGTINYNQPSPATEFGDVGFQHIYFKGSICIFDDGVPANHAYLLNMKYLKLLVHEKRDCSIRDFITPVDMDSITGRIYWAGNLVCNNLARQGVLLGTIDA